MTFASFSCAQLGAHQTRTERVEFVSQNDTLVGTLHLPHGPGPFATIVTAHGSGRILRSGEFLTAAAEFFVPRGIAIFAFDKRGVGESGGTYVGSYSSSMVTYGADVLAAVHHLQTRSDIRPDQIGLWGVSQAGWVIPIAAAMDQSAVAFTIIVSGPTVSIVEENRYSDLTGLTAGRPSGRTADEIDSLMAAEIPLGIDASSFIAELRMPGLWLYGDLDQSVPWRQGVQDLAQIKAEWSRDFTWRVFAGGNHGLKQSRTGGTWERPIPREFVEDFFEFQARWLQNHVGIAIRP